MKLLPLCSLILIAMGFARVDGANDPYADFVASYTPGTGFNLSYTNSSAALGAPTASALNNAPAFLNTDLVGVGNGGALIVGFNSPLLNDPTGHARGMDFTIFGNEFFTYSNSVISGLFNHTGLSVWVSQDNLTYFQLAAPYGADDFYPTQGNGDPFLPVSPSLTLSNFLGQSSPLSLYNGSAGGASFSISWAEDALGNPVSLASVSYVKIEGSSGFGYVDAVTRVESVPEPSSVALLLAGLGFLTFRAVTSSALARRRGESFLRTVVAVVPTARRRNEPKLG